MFVYDINKNTELVKSKDLPKVTDEQSAYELARVQRISLNGSYGRFDQADLEDIASNPPNVPWDEYLKLRDKNLKELIELYPELKLYNDLTWYNAFFYATRGIPANAPNSQEMIERHQLYQTLSNPGKVLLNRIYQDDKGFAKAKEPHPLEDYIIAYDQFLDNSGDIMLLANRIGFDIHNREGYPADEQFFDRMIDYIDQMGDHSKLITNHIPNTQSVIDMKKPEFNNMMKNFDLPPLKKNYNNRLLLTSELHRKEF